MRTRTPLPTAPSIPLHNAFWAELDSFLLACEAENLAPQDPSHPRGSGRAPGLVPGRSGDAHRARADPGRARRGINRRLANPCPIGRNRPLPTAQCRAPARTDPFPRAQAQACRKCHVADRVLILATKPDTAQIQGSAREGS
jgi:hypothetical protein